ncbi:MAG TPA: DUF418 domain-containing protein [Paenibacillus sp.]|uniref:DUF418 domain-containing protein n=1 Tax=Paenibacillus sp. TaxID=58172 RepID=UPI002BE4A16A|nr:DUF418 domain-containing protein [Paenibacillus sp.]HUC90490.1 DUF418 domain-containing protein [Paenibacillus sp.]
MAEGQFHRTERIEQVDIIRGFAVIGIFLVNVPEMLGTGIGFVTQFAGSDALIRLLYDMFVQTKFYTIFAFLFGLSFYLFMQSAQRRGLGARRLMARRLLLLAMAGLAHGVLLWYGDILLPYAILGFILLLFYKRTAHTALVWGVCLLGLAAFIIVGATSLSVWLAPESLNETLFQALPDMKDRIDFLVNVAAVNYLVLGPEILGLFLLGYYSGAKGWFAGAGPSAGILARLQWTALAVSILLFIPMVNAYLSNAVYNPNYVYHFTYLSGKTMAVFYVCTLMRLIQSLGARRFGGLAALGRLAFTNYLTQTLITIFLVYVVWRQANEWPLWANLAYAVVLLLIQTAWSTLWLRRFRMGPFEWIWRAGTYLQWPALRRNRTDNRDEAASRSN